MSKKISFDVVLIEKPDDHGLTKSEVMDLFDILKDTEAFPVEFDNEACGGSCAIGFIGADAADRICYSYGGLGKYIKSILTNMELENEYNCYNYNGLDIFLSR